MTFLNEAFILSLAEMVYEVIHLFLMQMEII